MNNPQLPPLSLYIHTPWCIKKCPYCDFNSHVFQNALPEADYLSRLQQDFLGEMAYIEGRALHSIFIGGGTPSLLSADFYQQLLDFLARHITFASDIEITLEANPGASEAARFHGYRQAGINRLSIGVQSFNDPHLRALGRIHTGEDALRARDMAAEAGFDNLNLDIMYRLPKQSVEQALADIDQAIALAPQHISWYELTLEPNTVFYSRPPVQPGDEQLDAMEVVGRQRLADAGFQRYEISAYSQPGQACSHNLNYWQFGDYLAIGAGAHGKVTRPDRQILRYHKTAQPSAYLATDAPKRGERQLTADELPLEFALNVLRLVDGVDEALFSQRTGLALETVATALSELRQRDLFEQAPRFACSPLGLRYLNEVLAAF